MKNFVNLKKNETQQESSNRRNRLHGILIALINQQNNLELMGDEVPVFNYPVNQPGKIESSKIIERDQRIIKKYQALVRSAIAIDALLESEQYDICDRKIS